jgi:hypothetical protein
MGANAVTSFPTYTTGQVLEAADLNITNCGVPTFADSTARDAAFGGTGEKTLAEGQLCYLEDSNIVQYYDGSSWATVGPATSGALVLVKSETVGTGVSSVTVTGAFSATYVSYRIGFQDVEFNTGNDNINVQLRTGGSTSTTGYSNALVYSLYSGGGVTAAVSSNGTQWNGVGRAQLTNEKCSFAFDLLGPYLASRTRFTSVVVGQDLAGSNGGFHNSATSYDEIVFTVSGTMTGGTIKIYGYAL